MPVEADHGWVCDRRLCFNWFGLRFADSSLGVVLIARSGVLRSPSDQRKPALPGHDACDAETDQHEGGTAKGERARPGARSRSRLSRGSRGVRGGRGARRQGRRGDDAERLREPERHLHRPADLEGCRIAAREAGELRSRGGRRTDLERARSVGRRDEEGVGGVDETVGVGSLVIRGHRIRHRRLILGPIGGDVGERRAGKGCEVGEEVAPLWIPVVGGDMVRAHLQAQGQHPLRGVGSVGQLRVQAGRGDQDDARVGGAVSRVDDRHLDGPRDLVDAEDLGLSGSSDVGHREHRQPRDEETRSDTACSVKAHLKTVFERIVDMRSGDLVAVECIDFESGASSGQRGVDTRTRGHELVGQGQRVCPSSPRPRRAQSMNDRPSTERRHRG